MLSVPCTHAALRRASAGVRAPTKPLARRRIRRERVRESEFGTVRNAAECRRKEEHGMSEARRRVDEVRRNASEIENNLIDAYDDGRITRRDFVRRGTVIGMSLPLLSFLATACGDGGAGEATTAAQEAGELRRGGTLRTAIIGPSASVDPLKVADEGGLAVLGQAGEYLTWSDEKLELQPRIAESWEPNGDGSIWTFKIRQGVTFHDGAALTAQDVAATLNTHADPDNGSPALSAFGGVLSKGVIGRASW